MKKIDLPILDIAGTITPVLHQFAGLFTATNHDTDASKITLTFPKVADANALVAALANVSDAAEVVQEADTSDATAAE